jgi:hypothetical protein
MERGHSGTCRLCGVVVIRFSNALGGGGGKEYVSYWCTGIVTARVPSPHERAPHAFALTQAISYEINCSALCSYCARPEYTSLSS